MRIFIRMAAVLALLGSRPAMAESSGETPAVSNRATATPSMAQDARWVGGAPIGHRQPRASDVPSQSGGSLEQLSAEDAQVDRKLSICRGCR